MMTAGIKSQAFSEKFKIPKKVNGLGSVSVEAWLYYGNPTSSNGGRAINLGNYEVYQNWCGTHPFCQGRWFMSTTNGMIEADTGSGPGEFVVVSNSEVSRNQWNHIAINAEGVDGGTISIWVNGILKAYVTGKAAYRADLLGLNLGQWGFWGQGDNGYRGYFDNVAVWNRTRTQAEIKKSMYGGLKGDENGLVAFYSFDT